jgi:hypothetical protein
MTKADNRAAAKAFREQQDQKRGEEARARAVAADREPLRALRHYLIFKKQAGGSPEDLIKAIDDYV